MQNPLLQTILITLLLASMISSAFADDKNPAFSPPKTCIDTLRSNCNASQQEMLDVLLERLQIYGISDQLKHYPDNKPAFQALPKDQAGLINWVMAVSIGQIKPLGNIKEEEKAEPYEGFLDNMIFMQAKATLLPDVVFPHGIHSYWLSCDSCHPKPFKKIRGENKIKMNDIYAGKWCGQCHGKVAFTTKNYTNCRRCHVLPKKKW